jgi:hypothetical protein
MGHGNYLPVPVDPEPSRRGIVAVVMKADNKPVVLIRSLDQRMLGQRLAGNARLDGDIIQSDLEQIIISACRKACDIPFASQRLDELSVSSFELDYASVAE